MQANPVPDTTPEVPGDPYAIITTAHSIQRWQAEELKRRARKLGIPQSMYMRQILDKEFGPLTCTPSHPIAA